MTDLNQRLLDAGIGDAKLRAQICTVAAASAATPDRTKIRSMAAAAAEAPELISTIRYLRAGALRLGYWIPEGHNEIIDTVELDRCLKGRDISARLELKIGLSKLGLIP